VTTPTLDLPAAGARMHALMTELFPICRSITGDGMRQTLRRLAREIPLTLHEVPSRTQVLDWSVPREWNITDAWVKNATGDRVVDFRASNLHVMSYSVPVRQRLTLAELRPHLHTLPDHPDWIPYRTSYYKEDWGFCLTQRQLDALPEGTYEACIESSLEAGQLTYAEGFIRGESADEVLISCHSCHPSLANDNLSGMALAVELARHLGAARPRLSYRFLFIPGTIGSITWLARNEATVDRIKHGLVLSCVGDRGPLTYKQSRRGERPIDRAAGHVVRQAGGTVEVFVPYGYDERQYCSPGFDLAVGCFMRTPNGRYPEYHTSADDLSLVTAPQLADSLGRCLEILEIVERDGVYVNRSPKGEPQLGRRGLYQATGGGELPGFEMALLWVLSYSDGQHSLLDIAEQAGMQFAVIRRAADSLLSADLLGPA
jgi:aminopeptidase-like protein